MGIPHEQPARLGLSGELPGRPTSGFQPRIDESAPAITDYELLRRVGRGAYGEVWLARNLTGSFVAVKVVSRTAFDYDRPFEREFEGIKRFEPISRSDPAQVAVLHVGRGEGFFYYVMELADDANAECGARNAESGATAHSPLRTPESYAPHTLREDLKRHGRLPVAQCIQIGLALTRALAHLHKCGLVHRDVKPSNVIFVGGVPKLADIGLVASVDATRSLVGTEGYVAPEGPGTPQADLYSLGKLLYEISTGCDRKEFPALPPDIATRPDRDALIELNAVVMRACQFDPRERHGNAEELQHDMALLERGHSVRKRRVWRQRIRALRGIGFATTAVPLVAAGITILWQALERNGAPLSASLPTEAITGTLNKEAAQAYASGLVALRRGTAGGCRLAYEKFSLAKQADTQFVAAYARLFEIYLMGEDYGPLTFPMDKAEQLSQLRQRSALLVGLAATNAETHAALAIVRFLGERNWKEAEEEFKQSLTLDPNCRMALTYYGYFLTRQRRAEEARKVLLRADKLDPESPLITKFLGHCDYVERRYEQALSRYRRSSDYDDTYPSSHYWAGRANVALGNYEQALDDFEEHESKQGSGVLSNPRDYKGLRQVLRANGLNGCWAKCLEAMNNDKTRSPYWYAECHARLGHKAQALAGLQEAVKQSDHVQDLLVDEFWDDYRNDPEFKEILRKVGMDRWAR